MPPSRLVWLFCLLSLALGARGQCPPRPDAAPCLDSTGFLVVEKYLARAVAMNGLTDEIVPAPYAWNGTPDSQPCYRGGDRFALASYDSAATCAGHCNFPYCPANFTADVALLVRLRASLVQFAAGSWDHPEYFRPGSDFLNAAGQTVERIHAAYDCAGLRHPLIQASVFENVQPGPVCGTAALPCATTPEGWPRPGPPGTNSGTRDVEIPARVIAEFRDELRTPADRAYYLDSLGQPRTGRRFSFARIAYPVWGFYAPDINQVEAQMWMYYQAVCFIDLGYTALHMGQPRLWGRLAGLTEAQRPAGMRRVARLMQRIRAYARQRPGSPAPFVLLLAEPMTDPLNYELTIVKLQTGQVRGRDQLIFDAQQASGWPRELSPRLDPYRHDVEGLRCQTPDTTAFAATPCAGQYLAVIDPCHGLNLGPDGGGHTPQGFTYAGQTPGGIGFDHGPTVLRQPDGRPVPTPTLAPGGGSTWSWDDSAWFTAALDDACQAHWLAYEAQEVRRFSQGHNFLVAPGRLFNAYTQGVADYRLAAHPTVAAAVAARWTPTVPVVRLQQAPAQGLRPTRQRGNPRPPCRQRLPRWQLSVGTPDATSLYSWHLRQPDGSWQAPIRADSLALLPAVPGQYRLYLRQDDRGLAPAFGDSRMWEVVGLPAAQAECAARHRLFGPRVPVAPVQRSAPLLQLLAKEEETQVLGRGQASAE